MFDALSLAEIDGQHAELLPARTVMSVFGMGGDKGNSASACSGNGNQSGLIPVNVLGDILNGNQILSNCTAVAG